MEDESGKVVTKVTSIANSPNLGLLGLGLARRTHSEMGVVLSAKVPAVGKATITAIPFDDASKLE